MSHYILFRLIPGNIVFGGQKRKGIEEIFLEVNKVKRLLVTTKNIFVFPRHFRHIRHIRHQYEKFSCLYFFLKDTAQRFRLPTVSFQLKILHSWEAHNFY